MLCGTPKMGRNFIKILSIWLRHNHKLVCLFSWFCLHSCLCRLSQANSTLLWTKNEAIQTNFSIFHPKTSFQCWNFRTWHRYGNPKPVHRRGNVQTRKEVAKKSQKSINTIGKNHTVSVALLVKLVSMAIRRSRVGLRFYGGTVTAQQWTYRQLRDFCQAKPIFSIWKPDFVLHYRSIQFIWIAKRWKRCVNCCIVSDKNGFDGQWRGAFTSCDR